MGRRTKSKVLLETVNWILDGEPIIESEEQEEEQTKSEKLNEQLQTETI